MKKITLSLGLAFLSVFANAQIGQGLDSIIVEKYYISTTADAAGSTAASAGVLSVGSVTYRVFVDLKPGWNFQALYGDENNTLLINTSTSFFNNEDRGSTNANAIGSQYLKNNTVALDSWFSIGGAASNQLGILKSEDDGAANLIFPHTESGLLTNSVSAMGIPLSTQDGMIAGTPQPIQFAGPASSSNSIFDATSQQGNSFSIGISGNPLSSGSVSSGASGNGAAKGPDSSTFNRVLIGQFTTDGTFHFELNITIKQDGTLTQEKWVASNPLAGKFTHASLTYTSTALTAGAPTVSITAPLNADIYTAGATVTIAATASDVGGSIDSVEFFVDGTKIGKDVSSPYSYTLTSTAGTHTLMAVATNNSGTKTTSNPVTINVTGTGINEITANSLFLVYPNPANDIINIEINTTQQIGSVGYTICDIIGNVILKKNLGVISSNYKEVVDVSSFPQGLYIIKMVSDNLILTKKIAVN